MENTLLLTIFDVEADVCKFGSYVMRSFRDPNIIELVCRKTFAHGKEKKKVIGEALTLMGTAA